MCKNNCNGCKQKTTTDAFGVIDNFIDGLGKPKMISVQIPEDLFNQVEAHAEESGLLTDDVVANAVYCHLVELESAK